MLIGVGLSVLLCTVHGLIFDVVVSFWVANAIGFRNLRTSLATMATVGSVVWRLLPLTVVAYHSWRSPRLVGDL